MAPRTPSQTPLRVPFDNSCHICILGAGGLGSLIGGWLAESGARVTLVARPAQVGVIRSRGLEISGIRGHHTIRRGLEAVATPDPVRGPIDALVLCVKARDTALALEMADALRDETRLVFSVQNSIEKEDALCAWIGAERVIGASTTEAGTLEAPGRVRHVATAPTAFYFGELDGSTSSRVAALVDVFNKAGFASQQTSEIRHVEWEKLLQIAVLAGWSVSTTGMMPGGSVAEALVVREAAEHYVAIARELLDVYRALGYEPRDFFHPFSRFRDLSRLGFEDAVASMQEQGQRMLDQGIVGRPSLHVDLLRAKPTEVEQCLLPFLVEAERRGIAVPTARAAYRIIRTLERMSS
ncbi:MAG: ketopantoate reductase family protein [Deltaproteobacteria bacterium]|nr:ketopantoate reductase family protein [Deltaproteobacteria bacterium]